MTLLIIIVTALFSIAAFNQPDLMYRYNFSPYQVVHRGQWYRIFTHAFLHVGWDHLIVNMIVLFSFGQALWYYLHVYFSGNTVLLFLGLYVGGIVVSSLYSLFREKDNFNYSAVGASGAVSAVTFACIFFDPMAQIQVFFILPIPGVIFGGLYLAYSYYMGKKNIDNVGHDAHFWGAVFGFFFPVLIKPSLFNHFIHQLLNF